MIKKCVTCGEDFEYEPTEWEFEEGEIFGDECECGECADGTYGTQDDSYDTLKITRAE